MTPRDFFGIVLRCTGLLGLIDWAFIFVGALATASGTLMTTSFVVSAFSGYLLRGAPLILEFAYPSSPESRWREGHARFSKGVERVAH